MAYHQPIWLLRIWNVNFLSLSLNLCHVVVFLQPFPSMSVWSQNDAIKNCHIYHEDENGCFILDQICPKWIKLDQIGFLTNDKWTFQLDHKDIVPIGSNQIWLDQISSNWFKLVQNGSKWIRLIIWFKSDKIGSNWFKLAQIGENPI